MICNHFYLEENERILMISGPNQGGKTTFARMVGQLHHLAALGCMVPGNSARMLLCDTIFTHFEKAENITNRHGKLAEDLIRIRAILQRCNSRSLIILNEIFNSTTTKDAVFLGTKIIEQILSIDAICIYVTFVDELTTISNRIVSMMSTTEDDNTHKRTFKICRKKADGQAYSRNLVEKYGLTYDKLNARLKS